MEVYLWWALAGIALVIAELVTGTFYLLVIGLAAFAGAAVSYLGYSFAAQAVVAAALAVIGVLLVTRFKAMQKSAPAVSLDVGQSVVLDSWVSVQDRLARVRYRNALWDANVLDTDAYAAGQVLYVQSVSGSTLSVTRVKPAK